MNECNEWGVIYTLDALALYQPEDDKEAEAYIYFLKINLGSLKESVQDYVIKILVLFYQPAKL